MNDQIFSSNIESFMSHNYWLILILFIWTITWKGFALWQSAKNGHKMVFVILLVLNTIGIGEIIYLTYLYFKNKKASPKNPHLLE